MVMTNLFSIFDPSLSLFSFSFLTVFLVFFILPPFFWLGGTFYSFYFSFLGAVMQEVGYVLKFCFKGVYSFIGSIFLLVVGFNFLALFPHIFSMTSHLLVTFPLSYTFWVGIILFSWTSSIKHFLSHLIPVGTPLALMSFMVVVELLSNFIRPMALTFRLTANMMAGHLLMSLVAGFLVTLPFSVMLVGSLVQSFLVIMELGVSVIQAYVFSTLLMLYVSEGEH